MSGDFKNHLIYKIHDRELLKYSKKYFTGKLLDIGCGTKPYKKLLSPFVEEHIGVDHEGTAHDKTKIDLFGTAYCIPVENNSFSSILCTAVLEHLEEPEKAIEESHRVLKIGGYAIYTVPFIWHLHEEPRDFYRFTKYGLKYLFEKVGFEVVELKALSGFWVTFGQLFVYNLFRLNRGPLKWFKIITGIGIIIQFLVYWLDKIDKTEQWTWMYIIVVKKKA